MLDIRDVLSPEIININGRKYRHLPVKSRNSNNTSDYDAGHATERLAAYVEEDMYYYDEPASCVNELDEVETTENGFKFTIEDIPADYFRHIYGKEGKKKTTIEQETHTKLTLPSKGQPGDIVITGSRKTDVIAAKTKLKAIIELHRYDSKSTHFLCIPLLNKEFNPVCDQFQREVLELKSRGVHASIFQAPERLHLTLCLTPFLNERELNTAASRIKEIVPELRSKHFFKDEIKIILEGIEYMNDDPGEIDVLYAKIRLPDNSNRLQMFVDELVDHLSRENFIKKQYETCKLHATVMNTLFRENKRPAHERKQGQQARDRITFDGREILKKFKDFYFGEVTFESVDISVKGSYDKDGRYKCVESVDINK